MKLKKLTLAKRSVTVPGTLIPLLLAIAGLAAAGVLLWLALLNQGNQRYQQDLANAYASQQLGAFNQALEQLDQDLIQVAANPQLQVALQQGGSPTLQRLMRFMFANNQAIYLNLPGDAEIIEDSRAPLSFAALDMIRRTERNLPVPMEAHKVGESWLLYAAKPLRASASAPIGGSLLAIFDMQQLSARLPPLPDSTGQITLVQQFSNAPAQTLLQQGRGAGEPIRLATSNPAWHLEFRPGPALTAGMINPLLLPGAALLALIGALAGLLWLQRSWNNALKADANTLTQLTLGHKVAGLQLGPLEPVGQNIMQLAKRSGRTLGPSPERDILPAAPLNSVSEHVSTEQLSNPIFQDTDILDIDIIDEHDPFALSDSPTNTSALDIPDLPAEIFRAYDIRGVVGQSLTAEGVYWLGRAIASESIACGQPEILVARDGRLSGPELSEQLIQGLMDSGCHVTDLGMAPTPVLYYATHTQESNSGVMLTGSHNPSDYNGLKIVIAGETLSGERIKALHQRLLDQELKSGSGSREQLDLLPAYLQRVVDDVALARPLRVVVDCGNGVAGVIAQELLESLGCTVIGLHCEVDGHFPNHHPDPGKLENLQDLIATVKQHSADIGIAFDGDADRLGVVTSDGEMIYPDRLLMLLAEDVVTRHPGADIVFDVKCTRRLPALISKVGGRPVMWKSGHSLIKAKMQETGALLGGEMSGHVFFKERWYGFDDGLYSACRLLEIISTHQGSSAEILARYPAGLSTPEINIEAGEERKFELIRLLGEQANWGKGKITTLDGLRIDYPEGWGLVRASNTTPMLVLRFEADTPEALDNIRQLFRDQLSAVAADIELTF